MSVSLNLSESEKETVKRFGLDRPEEPLSAHEAKKLIEQVLDRMEDWALPRPKVKKSTFSDDKDVAWFGGKGFPLDSSTHGGRPAPEVHRSFGIGDLFNQEAVYRLDSKRLAKRQKAEAKMAKAVQS